MIRSVGIGLLCCAVAFGQTNTGGITGTVFDSSGAVVPRAAIVVTNAGTNQSIRVKASDAGAFTVSPLDPVVYRISIEAPGFKQSIVENVKVNTATIATVNVTLQTGATSAEVTVQADAAGVNTESGATSSTITERQIVDAPLVNRSVLDLALTLPNISGDVGSENPTVTSGLTLPGYNLNANGGRAGSTLIMADGVNNTGVGIARAVVSFSPETVQEFTVQTSAYSAQFGKTGGGVINATTKSGTNEFHGAALWYTRNPATNASPFTTAIVNRPASNTRDNEFSATVGGPVIIPRIYHGKNKTFFFAAFEPRYRRDHIQADALVPNDAMRGGDFSNLAAVPGGWVPADVAAAFKVSPTGDSTIYQQFGLAGNQLTILPVPGTGQTFVAFPGNKIPQSMLDPTSMSLLKYLAHGSTYYLDSNGNIVNYTFNRFVQQDEKRYIAKIDENINDSNHLSFRITQIPTIGLKGFDQSIPGDVNGNAADYSYSRQLVLSDNHLFSPTVVNDFRANYTRGRFSGTYTPEWDVKTGNNLSTAYGLPSLTKGGLPMFNFEFTSSFSSIGSQGSGLNDNVEERYNISDNLYVNRGKMSWSFGFDVSHALLNELNFYSASGGNYNFRYLQSNSTSTGSGTGGIGFASFLLGVPQSVVLASAALPYYYRWNDGAAFVQNDWKVKPNLTLNLGMRYSLQFPRTEKYNHQGVFLPEQAQSFPLAKPLTLANGQTLTSALVPPFAFDGYGGRSKYLWPVNYTDFEPRFGFAWVPKLFGWNGAARFVVRGGYGLSHAPLTGQNRLPNPNFGVPSTTYSETSGQANPNYAMRLSSNPPQVTPLTFNQIVNVPSNGLIYLPGLNYSSAGFVLSNNVKTPYSQSWNMTLDFKPWANSNLEVAYVGNKGTHLFMPAINASPSDPNYIQALTNQNVSVTATIADPLGRTNSSGQVITVQQGSLANKFLGFNSLYTRYDSSADSIRHAAYVSFNHRTNKGLLFTANYTFGKSIDDASDASPDKGALTTESVSGEASFGGSRSIDRSVSTFDIRHSFNSTLLYDLPFGQGRRFLSHSWKPLQVAFGDWTVSAIGHIRTGYPFLVTMSDTNFLGDTAQTHTVRPDIVSGVPLRNPLFDPSCPTGNLCQPYLNPAAFERPAVGLLGNAPRTIDSVRGPLQEYFDASIQKNFRLDESGKRRLQLRVDLLNALNHPVLYPTPSSTGSDIFSAPATTNLTSAQYDAWAKFNNQPLSSTTAGAALLNQANSILTGARNTSGSLPANFFTVPLPQGFALTNPNQFDITTPNGLKLYRLKQAYSQGFGQLTAYPNPRYVQFGLKFIF